MKRICIAHLNIEMEYIDKCFFNYILSNYESNCFVEPDMILETKLVEEIIKPRGEVVEQIGDATIISLGDKQRSHYLTDSGSGEIVCATYYDESYKRVEIHISKKAPPQPGSITDYEYLYTGFAFSDRLTELGGAVLHGSAVAYKNQGIIFSGNSGIGKSSHTKLWKERFGSQASIINDDKPALRIYDGVPFIFGTPWSGKTHLNVNVQVPLKAIVFIRRAESNGMERLNIRDSIFNLMSQISRPYYDEAIGLKTITMIEQLVNYVPAYLLHCNTDPAAAVTVFQQLTQEGVIMP
ncbi:MAG: hypothetical protein ABRQ26_15200 [Syntrophomonadaceae bacterium]